MMFKPVKDNAKLLAAVGCQTILCDSKGNIRLSTGNPAVKRLMNEGVLVPIDRPAVPVAKNADEKPAAKSSPKLTNASVA